MTAYTTKFAIRLLIDISAIWVLTPSSAIGADRKVDGGTTKGWLMLPFNEAIDKLTPWFRGNAPIDLIKALHDAPMPHKDEFETSDDFAVRKKNAMHVPIMGTVKRDSLIAIDLNPKDLGSRALSYDADKGVMQVRISSSRYGVEDLIEFFSTYETLGTYVGTNSFGVKKKITKFKRTAFGLRHRGEISFQFPISLNDARRIKTSGRLLFIGKLKEPFASLQTKLHEPTISNPEELKDETFILELQTKEIWFFDLPTGEILYRLNVIEPPATGSDVDANWNTPLHRAIWEEKFALAKALVYAYRSDIDQQNKFYATALHMAVWKNQPQLVTALLAAGADKSIKDSDGLTAYEDAVRSGKEELANLLKN